MKTKKKVITHTCSKCGKEFKVTGTVRINTTNPWHLYQGSKKSWRNIDSLRLCKKHFKEFQAKLRKLIREY